MAAAITSGSANVTVVSTASLVAGMPVVATGIPLNANNLVNHKRHSVFVLSAKWQQLTNATATINVGLAVGSGLSTATGWRWYHCKDADSQSRRFQLLLNIPIDNWILSLNLAQDMKNCTVLMQKLSWATFFNWIVDWAKPSRF